MFNAIALGELCVAAIAATLAFSVSAQAQETPVAVMALLGRGIIAAAATFGAVRYSDRPTFVPVHFFFRQLANLLPVVVTAFAALRTVGGALPFSGAVLGAEGGVLIVATSVALLCFFSDEESYGKPIQLSATALLAASIGSGYFERGGDSQVHCLAAALSVFIARDVLLRKYLPRQLAEPLRRYTLAAALLLLWCALG